MTTSRQPRPFYAELLDINSAENALGITGLSNRQGQISEELFTQLRAWPARYRLYREMMDDAIIATLIDSIKLPLLAAEFTVSAASEESQDIEIKQFG